MFNIRTCHLPITNATYLRLEDVCKLLLEFGSTEEIDVKNRVEKLVENLKKDIK